jgi:hypothetical protein
VICYIGRLRRNLPVISKGDTTGRGPIETVYNKYRMNFETFEKVKQMFTLKQEVMAQWGNMRCSSTLSLTSAVERGGYLTPRSSTFLTGMTQYLLYMSLGGLKGCSGQTRKNLAPPGFDSPTV